jgi:hypothetical protein
LPKWAKPKGPDGIILAFPKKIGYSLALRAAPDGDKWRYGMVLEIGKEGFSSFDPDDLAPNVWAARAFSATRAYEMLYERKMDTDALVKYIEEMQKLAMPQ